ncbi:MAG: hypothetical protein F6K00_29980 [Leptolyngbya sp. SIOISBB]|nr:hypothetical protein [Leptolyngbya sp. SIOISBB]
MVSKFKVTGEIEERYGVAPNNPTEVEFRHPDNDDAVLVGIGLRAKSDNITTLNLLYARIGEDGTINQDDTVLIKKGVAPNNELEVWFQCPNPDEIIVGCGMRAKSDNVTTLHIHTRKLNSETGVLSQSHTHRAGQIPNHELEVDGRATADVERSCLRGMALRMKDDNVTTMVHYYGSIEAR